MTRVNLRFEGPWECLSAADRAALLRRERGGSGVGIRATAAALVDDVRARGDAALREQTSRFDGVDLETLEVPRAMLTAALESLAAPVRRALERAAANIARVHSAAPPALTSVSPEPGVVIVRRPEPLSRVGIYAPGGRAAYPSSVLMAAVPARAAGVGEIVLASPPDPGARGLPAAVVLAAAAVAGVDRVFAMGGAGAIAALAYGTESVPSVDRIVGPGNAWVAAAKLLVTDTVAIDCPAGPSELVVIADASCDPRTVALELVAQAEHDPRAMSVALVVGNDVATAIGRELSAVVAAATRSDVVREALATLGGILPVADLRGAVRAANWIAPEHLLLATSAAESLVADIRNAGSVFVGQSASVAFGDYLTGANHVLPTGGAARGYSGLSALDFVRWTTFQYVDRSAASRLAGDTGALADAEGLPGHSAAARQWSAA